MGKTVVEVLNFDQYIIKVHGSGRLTRRKRKFLHRYTQTLYYSTTPTHGYPVQECPAPKTLTPKESSQSREQANTLLPMAQPTLPQFKEPEMPDTRSETSKGTPASPSSFAALSRSPPSPQKTNRAPSQSTPAPQRISRALQRLADHNEKGSTEKNFDPNATRKTRSSQK